MSDEQNETTHEVELPRTASQRLWRLRRLHHFVDAELWSAGVDDVELRYSYDGERAYRRRWPNRALAVQEATEKRAELEREGWVFHW